MQHIQGSRIIVTDTRTDRSMTIYMPTKRKSYLLENYGEIREFSKTAYQKYLKAVKSGDYESQIEVWTSGKLMGLLDADLTGNGGFKIRIVNE